MLQVLAAASELRFEVSKQTALAFVIKQRPQDLQALAETISKRHGVVTGQQAQRLDVAYRSFAAAAAASAGNAGIIAVTGDDDQVCVCSWTCFYLQALVEVLRYVCNPGPVSACKPWLRPLQIVMTWSQQAQHPDLAYRALAAAAAAAAVY